ncbi:MAG: RNA-binding cell elongation regulator Jag/EloR [Bacillota bacterium]|nr:RNA-binding cell elongation regulator Jag/EloR [Bacillota bacterium]
MPVSIEKAAKTVQLAIQEALDELGLTDDDVIVEVLDEGESGLLGLGRRQARVRVTVEDEPVEADEPDPVEDAYYGDEEAYAGDPETPEEAETVSYVAAVLSGIGIHGKISSYREEESLHIEVNGRDCGAAIGRHGETLEAIQYLASLVANKHSEEHIRVIVDIAGYRRRRENTLINLAERTAEKVSSSGRLINLEPMNPAERRIIHSALQGFAGVTTYSEGEDAERHIVVAPAPED